MAGQRVTGARQQAALIVGVVGLFAASMLVLSPPSSAADPCTDVGGTLTGTTCSVSYTTTPNWFYTFTVPAGVTSVTVKATGASGTSTSAYSRTASGGLGNVIVATLAVSAADTLSVFLADNNGAPPTCGDGSDAGVGGYPAKITSGSNVLVAAGGGGGGCSTTAQTGGAGGAAGKTTDASGGNGTNGGGFPPQPGGGRGGASAAGGAGGTAGTSGSAGSAGGTLAGGAGGSDSAAEGGMGGGGAYGGGGGASGFDNGGAFSQAAAAGGGGGMSANTGFTIVSETLGTTPTEGSSAEISFDVSGLTTTTSSGSSSTTAGGTSTTFPATSTTFPPTSTTFPATSTTSPATSTTFGGSSTTTSTPGGLKVSGFSEPIDMRAVNLVKAGATVELRFRLTSGKTVVSDLGAVTGFEATTVPCNTLTGKTNRVEYTTSGDTSLRYNRSDKRFVQKWRVPSGKALCYTATVTTTGGSLTASFRTT